MTRDNDHTADGFFGRMAEDIDLVQRRLGSGGVPGRLSINGQGVTDWDDALTYGWYWSAPGAANTPPGPWSASGAYRGFVEAPGNGLGIIIQRAAPMNLWGPEMARVFDGSWSDWAPAEYLEGFIGTTATRDAQWGVPATSAERAALHNMFVKYWNANFGWFEQYFALDTDVGILTKGVVAAAGAGWYPVEGQTPRGLLSAAGGQARINGTAFDNWNAFGTGQSHRNNTLITRQSSYGLQCSVPGRYRAWCSMNYPIGAGTGIDSVYLRNVGQTVTYAQIQIATTLNGSNGVHVERSQGDILAPTGLLVFQYTDSATWTIGAANISEIGLEYLGPPLASV